MNHIIIEKFGKYPEIKCLDHGFVKLIDCMPGMLPEGEDSADYAIAEAARCSYQRGTKTLNDDKELIRYLIRHLHTSPLEMVEFKFHIKLPVFVARQWLRHRTASLNELSGRYSEMPEEYYLPPLEEMRTQGKTNKQGSGEGTIENNDKIKKMIEDTNKGSFDTYHKCLEAGLVRELSRTVLPLAVYTEMYWKMDLHNLLHFLDLRCDSHAQKEIRVYADAMLELITPIVPYTIEAWEDYSSYRGGMTLTAKEIKSLKEYMADPSEEALKIKNAGKIENIEWQNKLKKILPNDN